MPRGNPGTPRKTGGGRKPKAETPMTPRQVRFKAEQWAKVQRYGGSEWLRALVDAAPEPPA